MHSQCSSVPAGAIEQLKAGDETPVEMESPDTFLFLSLGAVLNKDDSFVYLLDAPVGSAYKWSGSLSCYIPALPEDNLLSN